MNSSLRTDLAIENAEMFHEQEELQGICIREEDGRRAEVQKKDFPFFYVGGIL